MWPSFEVFTTLHGFESTILMPRCFFFFFFSSFFSRSRNWPQQRNTARLGFRGSNLALGIPDQAFVLGILAASHELVKSKVAGNTWLEFHLLCGTSPVA